MLYKSVDAVQRQLKESIITGIKTKVRDLCIDVAQRYIQRNVYESYIPSGENPYDRTYELLESVTLGNIRVGTKYVTFDVFMDSSKITPDVREVGWNAHASVDPIDVSEYIPMWVEYGTTGSLWDRKPAYYMYDTWNELNNGKLARELSDSLRAQGWKVTNV